MVRETVPRSSRRFTAGTGRRCSLNVCWFRWKIRVRKQSGLTAIITAGAQEIKYEKAAGELPVKGEMKKQQVKYPKRVNEKAASAQNQLSGELSDSVANILSVKTYGREDYERGLFDQANREVVARDSKRMWPSLLRGIITDCIKDLILA